MNPRYPTSDRLRRHRPQKRLSLRVLLVGLLLGGGVVVFKSGDGDRDKKSAVAEAQVEKKAAKPKFPASDLEDIGKEGMTPVNVSPVPRRERSLPEKGALSPSQAMKLGAMAGETHRQEHSASGNRQTEVRSVGVETLKQDELMAIDVLRQKKPLVAPALPAAKVVAVDVPKQEKPVAADAANSGEPIVVDTVALTHPLPADLEPKAREPDVELTFYKELQNRKVVLLQEPSESPDKKDALQKVATSSQAEAVPLQDKKTGVAVNRVPTAEPNHVTRTESSGYSVQLGVFSDQSYAVVLMDQLRAQGTVARVVQAQSRNGTLFRVRVGPFSSYSEALREAKQRQMRGQSAVIMKDDSR